MQNVCHKKTSRRESQKFKWVGRLLGPIMNDEERNGKIKYAYIGYI